MSKKCTHCGKKINFFNSYEHDMKLYCRKCSDEGKWVWHIPEPEPFTPWYKRDSVGSSEPVELTPDVIERVSKAAEAAVNGTPSEELPDFVVTPRIDVSDM